MDDYFLLQEVENLNNNANRELRTNRRSLRETQDPFDLPENEFRKLYRLPKMAARDFVDELSPFMPETQRITSISSETQILSAINFFASGTYQRVIGSSFKTCMSQTSVSRSIHNAIIACEQVAHNWIEFPHTQEQIATTQARFFEKFQFPNVVGVIDGTHIAIVSVRNEIEEAYFNRKRYHSLNAMIVCNADNEITAVNARYGGRAHDQRVYRNSAVKHFMEQRYNRGQRNFWILGDSGYTLTPTLITPIHQPERGSPSERFNTVFIACRSIVERTIGILKGRWRCLRKERALHYDPVTAGRIVNMCCVLHNICRRYGIPDPALYRNPDEDDEEIIEMEREDGDVVRQQIVNEYFS